MNVRRETRETIIGLIAVILIVAAMVAYERMREAQGVPNASQSEIQEDPRR